MLPNSDDEYAKRIGLVNILCPKLGKQLLCMCCTKSEGYRVYFFISGKAYSTYEEVFAYQCIDCFVSLYVVL